MSENKLVGSLVLRTIDIDPVRFLPCAATSPGVPGTIIDTDIGLCAANGCYVTWKNVNIRCCIGELYKKYDRFNLKMTAVQIRHGLVALADAQFMIYMNGLPFSSGSTYNTRLGPTNQSVLGCVNFITTTSVGATISLTSGLVTFDKPLQDIIDISVELKNSCPRTTGTTINGYSEKPITLIGHWSITCDIYGVDN